ncbi:MAG: glycosyltransferase [Patescibacteria group bacterium]
MRVNKIFIHTNDKQGLGALLAKFAIEKHLPKDSLIKIEILNVDDLQEFKNFAGKRYLRGGREISYDPNDLQSFTLSRFMPPEKMKYEGRSIVIDPDIFAIGDISPLMNMDLQGKPLAACRKKDAWDTSVMVMDNSKLKHWKIKDFLSALEKKQTDYIDIMSLKFEPEIKELSRDWNSLDKLDKDTHMLHTTNRLTQPWKTGLQIDFTINPLPKIFGIIPREPIHKLLGKYPTHYLPHPNKNVEQFFIDLIKESYQAGAITMKEITKAVENKNVRTDLLKLVLG